MPYTRRVSVADAADTGYPDCQAVFVASPESATVRLGHDHHQAKTGKVIYIPAGPDSDAGRICR